MFNISSFLEKVKKNLESSEHQKKKLIIAIKKYTNIDVPETEIEIKNYIAYINSSPLIKNKLFIFKEKILNDPQSSFKNKIIDIR